MKIVRKLSLIFLGIMMLGFSVEGRAQYTIDLCQEKARNNYPLIRQYGLIENSRDYNLKNAGTAYLPQVSFQVKASYQSEAIELPFSIPGITMPSFDKDQYSAVVQIDQTIWDGGATSAKSL